MSSFNFTGASRRRNINLSGRTLGGNKKNFLQQIEKEREARSRQREILNASVTIQSAIRRYWTLQQATDAIRGEWETRLENGDNIDSIQALIEFNFFFPGSADEATKQNQMLRLEMVLASIDTAPWRVLATLLSRLEAVLTANQDSTKQISCRLVNEVLRIYRAHEDPDRIVLSEEFKKLANALVMPEHEMLILTLAEFAPRQTLQKLAGFSLQYTSGLGHSRMSAVADQLVPAITHIMNWLSEDMEMVWKQLEPHEPGDFLRILAVVHFGEPAVMDWHQNQRVFLRSLVALLSLCVITRFQPLKESLEKDSIIHNMMGTITSRDFLHEACHGLDAEADVMEVITPFFSMLLQITDHTGLKYKHSLTAFMLFHLLGKGLVHQLFASLADFVNSCEAARVSPLETTNILHPFWSRLFLFEELYLHLFSIGNDEEIFSKPEWLPKSSFLRFLTWLKPLGIKLVKSGLFDPDIDIDESFAPVNHYEPSHREGWATLINQMVALLRSVHSRNFFLRIVDEKFWIDPDLNVNNDTIAAWFRLIEHDMGGQGEFLKEIMNSPSTDRKAARAFCVLLKLPFSFAFRARVNMFQMMTHDDWIQERDKMQIEVSRDHLLIIAASLFSSDHVNTALLRKPFSVKFVDQFGQEEAGIDGGGLTKELLTSVLQKTLNPASCLPGVWARTSKTGLLYPSPEVEMRCRLQQANNLCTFIGIGDKSIEEFYPMLFHALGKLVGKCLYEGILVDIPFAPFFLRKWIRGSSESRQDDVYFSDLKDYDEELYQSLQKLLKMDRKQLEELDLNFTVTEKVSEWRAPEEGWVVPPPDYNGTDRVEDYALPEATITVPIIPNGETKRVDETNKYQFAHAMARFKLDTSVHAMSRYFTSGLYTAIPQFYFSLFDPNELQVLVAGAEKELNIDDLRANVEYGGYTEQDQTIQDLFSILENDFTKEDTSKFLKFVTSNPKAPLFGFKDLNPKFGIRNSGRDVGRLPTASTCVNLLKLPDYRDRELLKQKLLYSINSNAGFDLS